MKNIYFLWRVMLAVAVAMILCGFPANRLHAGEDGEKALISIDTRQSAAGNPRATNRTPARGNEIFATHTWPNPIAGGFFSLRHTSPRLFPQTGFLQAGDAFKNYLSSLRPDIQYSEDTHTQKVFMVLHLDALLSPGLNMMKNIEGGRLSAMLNSPAGLVLPNSLMLKPNLSASYIKNSESSAASGFHDDMVFKPFIRNPFQNGAISLSLPFSVTESLTISPAITYAFSIYDNVRQEYRGKAVISLIDKDSAIVYTGILLKYTF